MERIADEGISVFLDTSELEAEMLELARAAQAAPEAAKL
jgi:hypothetical protein